MLLPHDGPLPIAPGISPFQVKGLAYQTVLEEADAQVPGGLPAVLATLSDPALVRFFEQTFLAMSYYDALPILPLSVAICRLRGISFAAGVRAWAELRAQQDLQIYRTVLRTLSPDQAFLGMIRLWPRYFMFGRISAECRGPAFWEMRLEELPSLLIPWFLPLVEGYISVVLRATGIAESSLRVVDVPTLSKGPSLDLCGMRVEVRW